MAGKRRTALFSAFYKTGVSEFAVKLAALGWDILASSGTAKYLKENGIVARDVSEIVGPPILGHRVVTLSREIHAALLATEKPEDQAELDRLGIPRIDLVYVNLYPLREEIAKSGSTFESVIEKTDIGGPTLLRSAAKGGRIVLCRSSEFGIAEKLVGESWNESFTRQEALCALASIAEAEVSDYCHASCEFLRKCGKGFWG